MPLTKKLIITSNYYQEILAILKHAGGASRVVGGAVRDAILDKKNYDIDIVTNLLPEQVMEILSQFSIKVLPTGKKYGTVTVFLKEEKFEITTLRRDIKSNGRHPEIVFTNDFREDAARRDFTINALSYCPFEDKIYDYFNGIKDLTEGKVKFIGRACQRIQEDFLRILRFFRFSCYYAKQLDQDGLKACEGLKENLKFLSKERIKWEMDKLIIADNSANILQEMFEGGILQIILPVTEFNKQLLLRSIQLAKEFDNLQLYHIYSLLFYHIKDLQLRDLVNLKFSTKEATKIISVIKLIKLSSSLFTENMLRKIWWEHNDYLQCLNILVLMDKVDFRIAKKFAQAYYLRIRSIFPVNGHDLQRQNIYGKATGQIMKKLKNLWIASDFRLNKEQLLEYSDENYY